MSKITAAKILSRIDKGIIKARNEEPRGYLGMSSIGDSCPRKIWYKWRWAYIEKFSARMLRLFDRGNREEERFTLWLNDAGFKVVPFDPATGKQFEFSAQDGYAGGHSDGLVYLSKKKKAVGEYKTANQSNFNAMKRAQSVKVSKYEHYCQGQRYMHAQQIPLMLYLMINKNDDAIYPELVKYDSDTAQFLLERERELVTTPVPPLRISEDDNYWKCNYCVFKPNCFYNEKAIITCRMCEHIRLPGKGSWYCNKKSRMLSIKAQLKGCKKFSEIASF